MKTNTVYLSLICVATAAVGVPPIHAEPSYPAFQMPGLESDPAGTVSPRSCTVTMTGDRVTVDLSVSTVEEMPALSLNGAFFSWIGPSDPHPDRQFPELEIRIGGAPMRPEERFEAFVGKTNVTNLIKTAEMDPWAITRTPPLTEAHPKNVQVLSVLRNAGAIEKSGDAYLAKWTARRLLRIPIKTAPDQQVVLEYAARPVSSIMTADQLDTILREKTYCISPKQLKHLTRSGAPTAGLEVNEFSIPTGIDGKAPRSVILTLSPSAGEVANSPVHLFFCGPHGKPMAKKVSVTGEQAQVDDAGLLHVLRVAESIASQVR